MGITGVVGQVQSGLEPRIGMLEKPRMSMKEQDLHCFSQTCLLFLTADSSEALSSGGCEGVPL